MISISPSDGEDTQTSCKSWSSPACDTANTLTRDARLFPELARYASDIVKRKVHDDFGAIRCETKSETRSRRYIRFDTPLVFVGLPT